MRIEDLLREEVFLQKFGGKFCTTYVFRVDRMWRKSEVIRRVLVVKEA